MAMDEAGLRARKFDPNLRKLLQETEHGSGDDMIPVIIQTVDGLKDQDREMVERLGGKVKDDLYIINAFSAEVPRKALDSLILSERIVKIYHDAEVRAI